MNATIESLKFDKVSIGFEGNEVLSGCYFDFPMNQNCRIVFSGDREKFYFFHAVSQVAGFTQGHYLINGEDVTQFSFDEFTKFRLKIGFGFSTRGLIHNLTLRQNLELPLRYHLLMSKRRVGAWIDHCAEYFDINDDLKKRPAEVSPSAQKSALILRAFVHRPELIFLDTPDLMLSKKLQANLLQLIDDHRNEHQLKHLFFATYDENLSDCLSDQNIILRKKKLNLVSLEKRKRFAS